MSESNSQGKELFKEKNVELVNTGCVYTHTHAHTLLFLWWHNASCRILVSGPGIEARGHGRVSAKP